MDGDPAYKNVGKVRGYVQWYMMESKDFLSSITFKLKLKTENTMDKVLVSDIN